MNIFKLAKTFKSDDSGAVTVDWVVLTAAIVGLGLAVLASVKGGVEGLGDKIATELETNIDLGTGTSTDAGATTGG